jgi:hypothetical protein
MKDNYPGKGQNYGKLKKLLRSPQQKWEMCEQDAHTTTTAAFLSLF